MLEEGSTDFGAVKEPDCSGDASAAGTFHPASAASITAAMNLFFIPSFLQPDRLETESL
jgi:hypothetical protein